MFSVRKNENGTVIDARCTPKGTVVIKYANRDVVFVRRDRLARVWIQSDGSDGKTSELCWTYFDMPDQTWAFTFPTIDGERYIASAMFDSIINGGDDVVWREDEDEHRNRNRWYAVGLDETTAQAWPECVRSS